MTKKEKRELIDIAIYTKKAKLNQIGISRLRIKVTGCCEKTLLIYGKPAYRFSVNQDNIVISETVEL